MATFSKRKTTGFENQSRDIHYRPPPPPPRTLLPTRGPLSLASSMPGTQKGRGKGKIGHKPLENNKKTVTTSNH